jgi:hypothetical protein
LLPKAKSKGKGNSEKGTKGAGKGTAISKAKGKGKSGGSEEAAGKPKAKGGAKPKPQPTAPKSGLPEWMTASASAVKEELEDNDDLPEAKRKKQARACAVWSK